MNEEFDEDKELIARRRRRQEISNLSGIDLIREIMNLDGLVETTGANVRCLSLETGDPQFPAVGVVIRDDRTEAFGVVHTDPAGLKMLSHFHRTEPWH